MKIKKRSENFLVLVPHRDTRIILQKYSAELQKSIISNTPKIDFFHFPWVAPLVSLSKPLTEKELKAAAFALREAAGRKFFAKETGFIPFPRESDKSVLWGVKINFNAESAENNINKEFTRRRSDAADAERKIILGCYIIPKDSDFSLFPPSPSISFGAASLANMVWRSVKDKDGKEIGFEWEIGKLTWLPK